MQATAICTSKGTSIFLFLIQFLFTYFFRQEPRLSLNSLLTPNLWKSSCLSLGSTGITSMCYHFSYIFPCFCFVVFQIYLFNFKCTCVLCTHGGQEVVSDPLEVDFQMVVTFHMGTEPNPAPLQEQRLFLTAEPSLQPQFLSFIRILTWWEIVFVIENFAFAFYIQDLS